MRKFIFRMYDNYCNSKTIKEISFTNFEIDKTILIVTYNFQIIFHFLKFSIFVLFNETIPYKCIGIGWRNKCVSPFQSCLRKTRCLICIKEIRNITLQLYVYTKFTNLLMILFLYKVLLLFFTFQRSLQCNNGYISRLLKFCSMSSLLHFLNIILK